MSILHRPLVASFAAALVVGATLAQPIGPAAAQTAPSDYVNKGLVGVGRLPATMKDKFGETFGSGSGVAVDQKSWKKSGDSYTGTVFILPDRGYNVEGTTDYRDRLNKVTVTLRPTESGDGLAAEGTPITLKVEDTILLTDDKGEPMTGLDPAEGGVKPAAGNLPPLPQASNGRVALDPEGVVLLPDGSFFISDEYGPYIYHFSSAGKMLSAIRPPEALIPKRKGKDHFSANAPGPGAPKPDPANPETGRQNNQGLEGLALTPDGKHLVAILQSATRQDGGDKPETRNHVRILYYDITSPDQAKLVKHFVVSLPVFDVDGKPRIAAQSELLALDDSHFLLLCRDGNGLGQKNPTSLYRNVEVLDVTGATNIVGTPYEGLTPVAPGGKLVADVTPAKLTPFVDINDNAQLKKFGLHNGAPNDRSNLSEKWEGLGLVSALDPANPNDYFLLVVNDNDFLTTDGFQVGAPYKAEVDNDTVMLAYRITLPKK
jgi:hypothetical protein